MGTINAVLHGFDVALTWSNLYWCLLGCLVGTAIGVLPGVGPVATISMLLPLTYGIGPTASIIMLAGIYYGAQYGGSTTSILLNTPGEASSVMTCIDGNLMTKQGKAGTAILTAGISSFIAGVIAIILMAMFSIPISELALEFGPAEYTSLMLLGLMGVSLLTQGDIIKGLGMACIGVLLSTVGTDINTGLNRFTFNWIDLVDGIGVAVVAIGIFGVAESIKSLFEKDPPKVYNGSIQLLPTLNDIKKIIPSSVRGAIVGVVTGVLPGGGAAMSSFAAYMLEKKVNLKARLGTGAIEGVAAPEAANNAAAQSGFIPLLSLGIPENAVMALMLSALMINGITPGPQFITSNPSIFWALVASMLIGNLFLLILNVPLVRIWIQLIRVPRTILYPLVLIACAIGVYSINNNVNDIYITIFFGILGLMFMWLKLEPAPLMLGLVLGSLLEEHFRRQMLISRGSWMPFIERPITIGILLTIGIVLCYGIFKITKGRWS